MLSAYGSALAEKSSALVEREREQSFANDSKNAKTRSSLEPCLERISLKLALPFNLKVSKDSPNGWCKIAEMHFGHTCMTEFHVSVLHGDKNV